MSDLVINEESLDVFLREYFQYYTTLNSDWKKVFIDRVMRFMRAKTFLGREGFVPDNKVKAIVSSSAVQLTLGLEVWDLRYFDTILLFPGDFFNKQTGLNLKGETNLSGFMSLSWKSFIQGYKVTNDNLNLGLHEFTHALRFNGVRGEDTDHFFTEYFPKWFCFARSEFSKLNHNKPSIFRKYGGANINEFLSVSVEHFFESPIQFRNELPLLYSATAIMLNQKTTGDTTNVNIREEELKAQRAPVSFSPLDSNTGFFGTIFSIIGIILTVIAGFTILNTGLFSFPSLFMLGLAGFSFIRGDYKFASAYFSADRLEIRNGFFLFKNRSAYSVGPSQLISVEFFSEEAEYKTLSFTFLDSDHSFYEESVLFRLSSEEKTQLVSVLKSNYVWVKMPNA